MDDVLTSEETPTEEDPLLERLRRSGSLGPFVVGDWAALSDIGRERDRNEDRWIGDPDVGFVVADGMGGFEHGDLAAESVCRAAMADLAELSEATARLLVDRWHASVVEAGIARGTERVGSTLAAVAVRPNQVVVLNVGDTRVSRWREGRLEQLSHDHTVRSEMLAAGIALDDADFGDVRQDALTAYLGQRSDVGTMLHVASFAVVAGDRLLLTTDGIHGQLDPTQIEESLTAPTCREAVRRLVDHADRAGGRDNATAVAVELVAGAVA